MGLSLHYEFRAIDHQLPYTSKLEVVRDQTTSDFLVYSLQLPHIPSNSLVVAMVIMVALAMMVAMILVVI